MAEARNGFTICPLKNKTGPGIKIESHFQTATSKLNPSGAGEGKRLNERPGGAEA